MTPRVTVLGRVDAILGASSRQTALQRTAGIQCPVLFHYGTDDDQLRAPGSETADTYMAAVGRTLAANRVEYQIERYADERHNFANRFSTKNGEARDYSEQAEDLA